MSYLHLSRAMLLMTALLPVAAAHPKKSPLSKTHLPRQIIVQPKPLDEQSFDEILAQYTFVGDFEVKDAERSVSEEIFWRYPLTIPKIDFPIEFQVTNPKRELPSTKGAGRAVDHLNRGRVLFLEKNYLEAKRTWLSGRARYGKTYPFHRRNDYFIGLSFLHLVDTYLTDQKKTFKDLEVSGDLANAATFFSWAYILKADQPDPLLDEMAPKSLYNLAAIYWRYDRFGGAFGAADKGLDFLRISGRSDYRTQFHRIAAEAHIKNRTYLEAVQELDTAIRQDKDINQASAIFARVGDIYFDLNNFELAEDAYALGAKLDEDMRQINPSQLILRGESLFWLGRFSEAQKIFNFALEGTVIRNSTSPLTTDMASYAALRLADSFLALKNYEQAKLAYFKVAREYRGTPAARFAKMREACLELPFYKGHNIQHGRALLEEVKTSTTDFPPVAVELAWACQVGSYTDRERTPDMLERVRNFSDAYPESKFLASFADPVRELQAEQIKNYFKTGDVYGAVSFFEKNRSVLFPKGAGEVSAALFAAYADMYKPEKASEFWNSYDKEAEDDLKLLRQVTVAAELVGPKWSTKSQNLAKKLHRRAWTLAPSELGLSYTVRLLNSKTATSHLAWLYNLARHWAATDDKYLCNLEYPLLSKMHATLVESRPQVDSRVQQLIKEQLPALFRVDETCALSLLELEARGLKSQPSELGKRFIARQDWPLVGAFLHLYWTIAEQINEAGEGGDRAAKTTAKQLWGVIRDKGPAGAPEVQFSKARLDPTRTEFEKLWD